MWGFPDSSVAKESACNAGEPGLIPGLGRSAGEGKKLPSPVFWPGELHVLYGVTELDRTEWLSLLEKVMATHSSILAWRIPWSEEPGMLQSMDSRVRHDLVTKPPEGSKRFIPSFWKPKFKTPFALFMYMKTNSCQEKQIAKYRGWKMWIITGIKINI